MNKQLLYVVLPCYNEEDNIGELIKKWNTHSGKLEEKNILLKLVIVNDGSIDNTLNIIRRSERYYDNIIGLTYKENKGLGEAINIGINYVISQNDKGLLCIMDADLTHSPYYVYSMIEKLIKEDIQCVIASRYRKKSRVEGLSFIRKILSYGARVVYTFTFRIPGVRDYTCGYRLYKIEALKTLSDKYNGKVIKEKGFACMVEILFKLNKEGFKIAEIPFVLKYQLKGGKSKMKIFRTINRSLITIGRLKRLANEGII